MFHRIKVYRNASNHLKLDSKVQENYNRFIKEDTAGFTRDEDKRFVIQQKLLESFLTAIQVEISQIT